jgi:hypothetical protein
MTVLYLIGSAILSLVLIWIAIQIIAWLAGMVLTLVVGLIVLIGELFD